MAVYLTAPSAVFVRLQAFQLSSRIGGHSLHAPRRSPYVWWLFHAKNTQKERVECFGLSVYLPLSTVSMCEPSLSVLPVSMNGSIGCELGCILSRYVAMVVVLRWSLGNEETFCCLLWWSCRYPSSRASAMMRRWRGLQRQRVIVLNRMESSRNDSSLLALAAKSACARDEALTRGGYSM